MNPYKMSREDAQALVAKLTPQQRKVAELYAMGTESADVAVALGVSPRTVEIHLALVKKKWQLKRSYGIGRIWLAALQAPNPAQEANDEDQS